MRPVTATATTNGAESPRTALSGEGLEGARMRASPAVGRDAVALLSASLWRSKRASRRVESYTHNIRVTPSPGTANARPTGTSGLHLIFSCLTKCCCHGKCGPGVGIYSNFTRVGDLTPPLSLPVVFKFWHLVET